MQLIFLVIVFFTIILLLAFRRPLYQAILAGLAVTVFLYQIPVPEIAEGTIRVFTDWGNFSVLVSMYLITYLQKMLEEREQIKLAQQDLNRLFHNRRINAGGASMFIGLLPSAASTILCGSIVKDATDGYLDPKEQAFVTSWFRHVPECAFPTYASVLLMINLSGVGLPQFLVGMIPPFLLLILLGYFFYLRKVPKDPGTPISTNRVNDALQLFSHLWSLLAILVLIIICKVSVVPAVVIVMIAMVFVYRFRLKELIPMIRSSFELNLLCNIFLVLVLKELLDYTGVLQLLPEILAALPIPTYLIFAILFFVGTLISGTNGIIALGTPLAFAAIPGGMPLMVLLMCMCHAASQVSPTHICLVIAADYFHVTLGI